MCALLRLINVISLRVGHLSSRSHATEALTGWSMVDELSHPPAPRLSSVGSRPHTSTACGMERADVGWMATGWKAARGLLSRRKFPASTGQATQTATLGGDNKPDLQFSLG